MKVLVIVNASPWGGSLAVTALRMVRAMLLQGLSVDSIQFRGEGVYTAMAGQGTDPGTPGFPEAWLELAVEHGFPLLLCSSASTRRLDTVPQNGFRAAGLPEMLERMAACDRVVTF